MEHSLGQNVHKEPRLALELVGSHEIFRFAVNMLDDQVEFCEAGRIIIVELREMVGPERFDPWARNLLGQERHDRLAAYFLRDGHCVSCERELDAGETRRPLKNAAVICKDCDPGEES